MQASAPASAVRFHGNFTEDEPPLYEGTVSGFGNADSPGDPGYGDYNGFDCGFPGETAADVDETIDVVKKVQYDNAFTFIYSKRTGTPAAAMENQVPKEEIKTNFDRLLKVVQDTARERVSRYQGQVMEALIEEVNENDSSMVTGRLSNNTIVHIPGDASMIGSLVMVSLDECHGFYYIGHCV